MAELREADLKAKFAEILAVDPAAKDWGGETHDLSASVHLSGRAREAQPSDARIQV